MEGVLSFYFFMLQLNYVSAKVLTWERHSRPEDVGPFQAPTLFQEESQWTQFPRRDR